jgi:DNA-binding MurR/RpiR family transcriptional regulator
MGGLFPDMVGSAIRNIVETFSGISAEILRNTAAAIWSSRFVSALTMPMRSCSYLASTGMVQFHAIPRSGNSAADDLAFADKREGLNAITCKPFRTEVIEAVDADQVQGIRVIGISAGIGLTSSFSARVQRGSWPARITRGHTR